MDLYFEGRHKDAPKKKSRLPKLTNITLATGLTASGMLLTGQGLKALSPEIGDVKPVTGVSHVLKEIDSSAMLELAWTLTSVSVILLTTRAIKIGLDINQPLMTAGHAGAIGLYSVLAFNQAPFIRALTPLIVIPYLLGQSNHLRNNANPLEGQEFDLKPIIRLFSPSNLRAMLSPEMSEAEVQKLSRYALAALRGDRKALEAFKRLPAQVSRKIAAKSPELGLYLTGAIKRVLDPAGPSRELAGLLKKDRDAWKKPQAAMSDLSTQLHFLAGALAMANASGVIPSATNGMQSLAQGILLLATSIQMLPNFVKGVANRKELFGKLYAASSVLLAVGRTGSAVSDPGTAATLRGVEGVGEVLASEAAVRDAKVYMTIDEGIRQAQLLSFTAYNGEILLSVLLASNIDLGEAERLALTSVIHAAEAARVRDGIPLHVSLEKVGALFSTDTQLQNLSHIMAQVPAVPPSIARQDEPAIEQAQAYIGEVITKATRPGSIYPHEILHHYRILRDNGVELPAETKERVRRLLDIALERKDQEFRKQYELFPNWRKNGFASDDFVPYISRQLALIDGYYEYFSQKRDVHPSLVEGRKEMRSQLNFVHSLEVSESSDFKAINEYGQKMLVVGKGLINAYAILVKSRNIQINAGDAITLRGMIENCLDSLDVLGKKCKLTIAELPDSIWNKNRFEYLLALGINAQKEELLKRYGMLKSMNVPKDLFTLAK